MWHTLEHLHASERYIYTFVCTRRFSSGQKKNWNYLDLMKKLFRIVLSSLNGSWQLTIITIMTYYPFCDSVQLRYCCTGTVLVSCLGLKLNSIVLNHRKLRLTSYCWIVGEWEVEQLSTFICLCMQCPSPSLPSSSSFDLMLRSSDVIPFLYLIPVYGLCISAALEPIGIKI